MAITVSSFTNTPTVSTKTVIAADQAFDEATIYFGHGGTNNTTSVKVYVAGQSHPIVFPPGYVWILTGAGGEELNFNQFEIETSTTGDGVTIIYQLHNPYAS